MTRRLLASAVLALSALPLHAQTIDDSLMVPKKALFLGLAYGHDSWTDYWEGSLKRDNDNVGELTTNSVVWMGNYGITRDLNVIAMIGECASQASRSPAARLSAPITCAMQMPGLPLARA